MARSAELVLVPYNYLLDPNLRRRHKIDVKDKIVIIDEAHNVESVCEEAYSMTLKSTDIEASLDECDEMLKVGKRGEGTTQEQQNDELHEQVGNLKNSLVELKKILNEEFAKSIDQESTLVQLRNAFNRAQLLIKTQEKMEMIDDFVYKLQKQLADAGVATRGQKIGELVELMRYFYLNPTDMEKMAVYVRRQEEPRGRRFGELYRRCTTTVPLHIDVWCFDASRAIRALKDEQVSSMIFTSGTLSPLTHYMSEMGLDMQSTVRLMGTHVIEPGQLLVGTVPVSNGVELKNVFQNRENRIMFVEMGEIIKQVQSVTRGGVLVFHPTYKLMNLATEYWSDLQLDSLFNESTDNMELTMAQFENALTMKKSPILQGVCRGKISEGVDFADHRGRCCFITGVPYAPVMDPKVKLKIAAVGSRYNWYQVQAMRAINQAVGRIIRHRYDYGAIVFLDARFRQYNMRKYLPKWMEANHQVFESGEQLRLKTRIFFNKLQAMSKRWVKPEVPSTLPKVERDLSVKMEATKLTDQTLTEEHMELINAELERKFPIKAEWKRANTTATESETPYVAAPARKRRKRSLSIDQQYTDLCGAIKKKDTEDITPLGDTDTMDTLERREELKHFLIFVKGILSRAKCDSNVWFEFKCELTALLFAENDDLEYETVVTFIDKWTLSLKPKLGHYLIRIIMVFTVRLLSHMEPYDWLDELDTGDISYEEAWREVSSIAMYFTAAKQENNKK